MAYAIILCRRCRRPVGIKANQKTRTCAFCGAKNRVDEVEIVHRTKTARQLTEVLSRLKKTMQQ